MDSVVHYCELLIAPILVVAGLLLTHRHFKIARTVSYIERFNNPGMVGTRAKVDEWLESSSDDERRIVAATDDSVLKASIFAFLNLFVELGIAYRYGLLNRKVAFDMWDQLVPEYWKKLEFWVRHNRLQGRDIAQAFEDLAKEMNQAKQSVFWSRITSIWR